MAKQQIPALQYDVKHLNEAIPIRDAIQLYTDVDPHKRGGTIRCPSPEHADKKPSAHIYGNHCHCFSCGKTLKPVDLAVECFPSLKFSEICGKLIQDFGLNAYDFSNQAEIDAITNANGKNKFFDCFPVSEAELNTVGLHNPTAGTEITYGVKATEYFEKLFGEIPPNAETHDKNGNELIIECTRGEMIDMDYFVPTKEELENGHIEQHEYQKKLPSLRDLWNDDKKGVEEMIIGKCYERMERINEAIVAVQTEVDDYRNTHTVNQIKEASRYRDAYDKAIDEFKFVKLSPEQEKKIDNLVTFEDNKDVLRFFNKELDRVDEILHKVLYHEKQREQQAKKDKSWGR